ncbi:tRNA-dihydrouridine(47) synthase [NAD(P)(+)]-like [Anthonomus grandis grandis]|uniref:tRNA-dihydrouridine(47) synthase [NAD(P)(+)]-like n=1 Tax=Anthonomus grandis grandis TaxID=2921223 RepID=UPI0021656445|nr:tRNA-dihydrouridine(47) synthase [NAD(P)(+)]-like [Anthonomus grandis grandis]
MSEDHGICHIKPQYVLPEHERVLNLAHVSEKDKQVLEATKVKQEEKEIVEDVGGEGEGAEEGNGEPKPKKRKIFDKKLKGQNKKRGKSFFQNREDELCESLIHLQDGEEVPECTRKNCVCQHSIEEYLAKKPEDIGPKCYTFEISGRCSRGLACRFGKSHISANGRNIIDQNKYEEYKKTPTIRNMLGRDVITTIRKRQYDFNLAEKLIDTYDNEKTRTNNSMTPEELFAFLKRPARKTFGTVTDEDIIKLKSQEKKKINWNNKLYLSPLTTVGNLPFRRICKEFGADITCGEMAMCSSLLQTIPQEWALMKRHHTEDIFGVQLCANNPYLLTKCGLILERECDVDFIDLNMGCPIEWVFKKGAGSGMLLRPKILEACVRNLSDLISVPMTVKLRTGAYKDDNVAHELAPKLRDWGASMITIHGRSREQRYTKSADWAYIRQVAQAADPCPVFGCGDVLSYEDYKRCWEQAPEISGIMIGRGALIKPWIFTEIKEKRLWDITSSQRLELIGKYVNYSLEHWGSDNRGVENCRRFLLEWLSFLHRYVPVGLLENPPQKINERAPLFKGRDEMETLLASQSASDWIKITEMFLGKVPEGFRFIPKHKANSYEQMQG